MNLHNEAHRNATKRVNVAMEEPVENFLKELTRPMGNTHEVMGWEALDSSLPWIPVGLRIERQRQIPGRHFFHP